MLGYYGLMQLMFAELMISLICFNRYLENRKKKYLILSIVFFTIGLMSYEMFYHLILLYFLLAWNSQKKWRRVLSFCIPFILIEGILLSVSFGFRFYSANMGFDTTLGQHSVLTLRNSYPHGLIRLCSDSSQLPDGRE